MVPRCWITQTNEATPARLGISCLSSWLKALEAVIDFDTLRRPTSML